MTAHTGSFAGNDIASITIDHHVVGPSEPVFIIAEIGINHNGSIEKAKELIDIAKKAGVNAVKFQKRDLKSIYQNEILTNLKNFEQGFQYIIPILQDYELSPDQIFELKEYTEEAGLTFLCTPFDIVSALQLEEMGTPCYKVSSADLTNFELLEYLADFSKPLLLSTGMSYEYEIQKTVDFLVERKSSFALLHCVSCYPVDPRDANLGRIRSLMSHYGVPVGYSGHDVGTALSVIATSLGATIIEKHITTDKSLRGPDHKVSLLPQELYRLVASIRESEQATLEPQDELLQGELLNKMIFRKSIVAKSPIKLGEEITREQLTVKSPGTGLSPQKLYELVGKIAKRNLAVDDLFQESDLLETTETRIVEMPNWGQGGIVVRYHDFETALPFQTQSLEFHFTYQDTLLELPREKLEKYRFELQRKSLRVHCCEYIGENLFDLCSQYPDIRARSVETLQQVINRTSELSEYFNDETPLIVFNVGAMSLAKDVRDTEIDVPEFYRLIGELDLKNTKLMAQNMPPNPWYFGGQWKGHYFLEAQELIDFCEATGQYICLDLSHASMACLHMKEDYLSYLAQLKPYTRHIHIADAKGAEGEGTQIGTGDVDFVGFFQIFSDYTGTWIPEIWQGHINNHEGALEALGHLSKLLQESKKSLFLDSTNRKTEDALLPSSESTTAKNRETGNIQPRGS
ncbi:MAG: N-acetylneuraminate synthase family protein [Bdellovibrionales bacterium]|nr:N-acetylneuraminate synthase family protein [Bdellovibrionales bacterium]